MASGEHLSRGGNFLDNFRKGKLARMAGMLAVVASAAGGVAGCESTAAGGGSGSRSVNNVIEQSTTGVENGWIGYCLDDGNGLDAGPCHIVVCDGEEAVSFTSSNVDLESGSSDKQRIEWEINGYNSFYNSDTSPSPHECGNQTYGFKTVESDNLVERGEIVLSDLNSNGSDSGNNKNIIIEKNDYKKPGVPTFYTIKREGE
mgnify:CR=1 FL=1